MNRKLRNSFSAFAASGAALAIALMVAMPAATSPVMDVALQASPAAASVAARAAADLDPAAQHLETLAHAVATSAAAASVLALEAKHDMDATRTRVSPKGSRHRRQTLVMPYFSFSPRG
jgi:hypothetical protein